MAFIDRFVGLLTSALVLAQPAGAALVAADWVDETAGVLGGVGFTVTGGDSHFPPVLMSDLSGSDYSYAPLKNVEVLQYRTNANISFVFDTPISNLLLYAGYWRGEFVSGFDEPASVYTLSPAFSVESGFTKSQIAGPTISIDDDVTDFDGGILSFAGPVSSLSITYTAGADLDYGQSLTFAVDLAPVPIPAGIVLMVTGVGCLGAASRRRMSQGQM
ncbi:hypothetical protein RGUI_3903 [Rhodovulum sp. P5]|uniref:VPLPA-CTERM sorting domain-containing protein n=1 Tax=Rhodovulum sp. P5 TaxID=1564506 RepID=UPI0009C2820D|nr:VPLPA-CTERM sorting domain-containing protein [Rhodovulum sp. P5]ARE42044.1 hypothetical protein RGUI_3903 [Rhodovulum sp. P5]